MDAPALDNLPRHEDHRPGRSRGGYRSPVLRTRSAARPGQPRARLTRPKSFRYHFAAEALL